MRLHAIELILEPLAFVYEENADAEFCPPRGKNVNVRFGNDPIALVRGF